MPPDQVNRSPKSRFLSDLGLLAVVVTALFVVNARGFRPNSLPAHDTLGALSGFVIFSKHLHQYGELPFWRPYSTFGMPMDWLQLYMSPASCFFALLGAAGPGGHHVLLFKLSLIAEQLAFAGACCWLACLIFKNSLARILFVGSSILSANCWMQIYLNFRWVSSLPWILIFLLLSFRKRSRLCLLFSCLFVVASMYGNSFYTVIPHAMFWACAFLTLYFHARKKGQSRWLTARISFQESKEQFGTAGFLGLMILFILAQLLLAKTYQTPVSAGRDANGLVTLDSFLSHGNATTPGQLFQTMAFGPRSFLEITLFLGLPLLALAAVGFFQRGVSVQIFKNQAALFAAFCISGFFTMALFYFPGFNFFRHVAYTAVFLRFSLCVLAGIGLQQLLENLLHPQKKLTGPQSLTVAICAIITGVLLHSFKETGFPKSFGGAFENYALRMSTEGGAIFLLFLLLMKFRVRLPWAGPLLLTGIPLGILGLVNWQVAGPPMVLSDPKLAPFKAALSSPIMPVMERMKHPPELDESFAFIRTTGHTILYDVLDLAINIDEPQKRRYDLLPEDTAMILNLTKGKIPLFEKLTLSGMPKAFLAVPTVPSVGTARPISLQDPETPFVLPVKKRDAMMGIQPDDFSFNEISFTVPPADVDTASKKRYLVYADAFHPEWKAEINGKPAPVVRANVMFKAVALDNGPAKIRFFFGSPYRHFIGWANYTIAVMFFTMQVGLLTVAGWRHFAASMSPVPSDD